MEEPARREIRRCELEADRRVADRLADLETWLERCRKLLAPAVDPEQERRARRLAERILADTTREDFSWRGDLRLVVGYVGERLRASAALRVIAASLLLHLLGLPLLAWVGWLRPEEGGPRILVEPPRRSPFATYEEPARVVTDPEQERLELARRAALAERRYVQNSLRWSRWRLAHEPPTAVAPAGDETPAEAVLRERLAALSGARGMADPATLRPAPDASPAHLALWSELWLDRYLVDGGDEAELDAALGRLCSDPHRLGRLGISALARAEAFGQLTSEQARALRRAREGIAPGDPRAALLLRQDSARRAAPLGEDWVGFLEVEGSGSVSRAWLRALRAP
jgi:hypothetical protein